MNRFFKFLQIILIEQLLGRLPLVTPVGGAYPLDLLLTLPIVEPLEEPLHYCPIIGLTPLGVVAPFQLSDNLLAILLHDIGETPSIQLFG